MLQMRFKEKLGAGIAMSLGTVPDDEAILNIWDLAEVSITIIAASIPTLRVLFRDMSSSAGDKYYRQAKLEVFPSPRTPRTTAILDSNGKILRVDEVEVKHGQVVADEKQYTEGAFKMKSMR
ncbi:hypothetical protein B0H67DRAFT_558540 [Lasiosphaeris hirsuta]|uniref:Uncharacterized protein n=1 Tax=Lasiosphaeris hirsuta TaxID=260670 RepID=A0AA39ZRM5_9PEZI|nr:hypothetical protein B0H67DRAFT_558540 [Lasiosphaeris hirsuta]